MGMSRGEDSSGLLHGKLGSLGGLKNQNHGLKYLAFAIFIGISIPILIPLGHILIFYLLWGDVVYPVNRNTCICNCWDTLFKGPYESGVAGYKHVYFNGTTNTLKMWIVTVLFVIFLYESFKRLVVLVTRGHLRWSMALLFLTSLHSHYYAWWGYWNYWNDDFYSQWWHQTFFTITELASTALVLAALDKEKALRPLPLILIANVAVFHIGMAMWDQFFVNVFQGQGLLHQVLRDLFLMSTDCIQVGVAVRELWKYADPKAVPLRQILLQKPHLAAIGTTTFLMYFYILICP